jgi:hypothetical protein
VTGRLHVATKTLGKQTYEYRLCTVVTRKWIYTFEAWGKTDAMAADREALDQACRSLRIRGE